MNGSWNAGLEAAHPEAQACAASVLPGFIWVMQPLPSTPIGGTYLCGGGLEDGPWVRIADC